MSKTDLTDNFTYISAIRMLTQLVAQGLLTDAEGELTQKELERKLRPTVILA